MTDIYLGLGAIGIYNLPFFSTFGLLPSDPLAPFVVIMSCSCFMFFCGMDVSHDFHCFGKYTADSYLIHVLFLQIVKIIMQRYCNGSLLKPCIGIPMMFLLVTLTSFIYSYIFSKTKEKFWNKIIAILTI